MKAIQAENYGCTDLSQVELAQTKGGATLISLVVVTKMVKEMFKAGVILSRNAAGRASVVQLPELKSAAVRKKNDYRVLDCNMLLGA